MPMRLVEVDPNEVGIRKRGRYRPIIEDFADRGIELALVEGIDGASLQRAYKGLCHTAARIGAPVKVMKRGDSVYLARTDGGDWS